MHLEKNVKKCVLKMHLEKNVKKCVLKMHLEKNVKKECEKCEKNTFEHPVGKVDL